MEISLTKILYVDIKKNNKEMKTPIHDIKIIHELHDRYLFHRYKKYREEEKKLVRVLQAALALTMLSIAWALVFEAFLS